jgi:FAD binding domain/Berberine and berberine like
MASTLTLAPAPGPALDGALDGRLCPPGSPGFDAACAGFDLAAIPAPAVAVRAASEADVSAAVRFAARRGLPVAVRATGHGPIPGADGGVLIDTRAMSAVTVDPARRTATIGAGATWAPVLAACAPHGLAPLCGSAPGVGAISYTLGGGLGPIGRRYGYSADRVRRLRVVTATGEAREVTADTEPELFWAIRGGGGNFGVTTELEIDLMPVSRLYGGGLFFPGEAAPELLGAFGRATAVAPDELSLSIAFITFPDIDPVPAPLRGRFVAHLRVAYLGDPAEAEALIAPLRAIARPLADTVRPLPVTEIGSIHSDPSRPQPVSCGSSILPRWNLGAAGVLLSHLGASTPHMLEVRHLGGALSAPPAGGNSVGHRDAQYTVFTSAYPGPRFASAAVQQAQLHRQLRSWSGGQMLYNFAAVPDGHAADAGLAFDAPAFTRLRSVKRVWDPGNMFRFNVNIPPAI